MILKGEVIVTEIQDGWSLDPDKRDPTGMVLIKTLWTDKLEGDKQGEFPVGKAVEAYEVPKAEAIVKANSGEQWQRPLFEDSYYFYYQI